MMSPEQIRGSSGLDRDRLYGAPRLGTETGPMDPGRTTPASRDLEPLGPPPRASELRCSPRVFAALIAVMLLLGVGGLKAALDVGRPGSDGVSRPGSDETSPLPPTFPVALPPVGPVTSPLPTSMPPSPAPSPAPTPTAAPVATPSTAPARPSEPQRPTPTRSTPRPSPSNPSTRPTTGTCQYSISFEPTSGDYLATIVVTNTTPDTVRNRQGASGVNAIDQMMKDWNPTMEWPEDYEIRRDNGLTIRFFTMTQARSELSALVQKWLVCG